MKTWILPILVLSVVVPATATSRTFQAPYDPVPTKDVALVDDGEPSLRPEAPKPPKPKTIKAYVTGYNTVPDQTDGSPCDAAAGNICGRRDTAACPSSIPLRSWVEIGGRRYQCMDRTAAKHDGRFDISCDKDMQCPYRVTGWKEVTIVE